MPYPLAVVPELHPLMLALKRHRVRVYLYGYLDECRLPFIDLARTASAALSEHLPENFTFIYAYPLSGQAFVNGDPDPLQENIEGLAARLKSMQPKGLSQEMYQQNFDALLRQAEYLLQFPPTRLVYVGPGRVQEADINAWFTSAGPMLEG